MGNTPLLNLVVLISGSGSNLQAIIDNIHQNELPARISAVISDQSDAYGLVRANQAGIPTATCLRKDFPSKQEHEAALVRIIDQSNPDLIVLAGFMRILSSAFVHRFESKIINIHPSLLPKFKGLNTHKRAIEAGEVVHGATVHVVTPLLDDGPIIIQGKVDISPSDTADSLQKKVLKTEHIIYSQAIQQLADQQSESKDSKPI